MCQEYNGWTNRETWAVALHINNDQGLYNQVREMANEYTTQRENASIANESWLFAQYCDQIENFIDDLFDEQWESLKAMRNDIGSLYRVNWREIAESFVEEKVSA
jgi:hypothetical protein